MAGRKLTKSQLTSHLEAYHGHPRTYGDPYDAMNTTQFRELHEGDHATGRFSHEHTNLLGKTTMGRTEQRPGFSHGGPSTMDIVTDRRGGAVAANSERQAELQRRPTPTMDYVSQLVARGQ